MLLFTSIQRSGAKFFTFTALALIAIATLTLLFPMVLAVIFAALCFLAAAACLKFAWKIYRASGSINNHPHIHVETPYEHDPIQ